MRIAPLEKENASWLLRPLYWAMKRQFGKVLTPYKVWAHRPGPLLGFSVCMATLEFSKVLDPTIKRLVCLRSAQIIGCVF